MFNVHLKADIKTTLELEQTGHSRISSYWTLIAGNQPKQDFEVGGGERGIPVMTILHVSRGPYDRCVPGLRSNPPSPHPALCRYAIARIQRQ